MLKPRGWASKCPNKRIISLTEHQASSEELEEEVEGGERSCT